MPQVNLRAVLMRTCRRYNYVPFSVVDVSSVGRQTREGSRTLEYAFEDFAIHQVAQLLGKTEDEATYYNRSLVIIFQSNKSSG